MSALVVGLLCAAAWVGVGPPAGAALGRLDSDGRPPARTRRQVIAVGGFGAGLGLVGLLGGARWFGWALAAGVAGMTVFWVVRSGMNAARRRRRQDETARAATTVSLLLRSGYLPGEALAETATDCPGLAPVAAAARVGADVGLALDEAAREEGRLGLANVAAAWRVSHRTGAPMAGLLAQVAKVLRRDREVADLVEAELSSAQASSRIMAALPFVAIGLGIASGADPMGFLFGSALGEVLFIAGVCLAAIGVVWTERLASSAGSGTAP